MKRQRRRDRRDQSYFKGILVLLLCLMLRSSTLLAMAGSEPANNRTVKAGMFFVGYDNTWEEMQSILLSGEIDVVTSARKTRAQTEAFGFSIPIEHNSTVLSILESNISIISGDYHTYDGMTVGVLAGSLHLQALMPAQHLDQQEGAAASVAAPS